MRGRKPSIIEAINDFDFDALAKRTSNPRERIRYLAFAHIQEGQSLTKAAEMVRIKLRTLMNWVKRFRESGIEGLQDRPGRGAKPHLAQEKHEAFRQAVLKLQAERKGGRIKGRDILELMKEKFGITPSKSSLYDTLKRTGLVWITGRSKHSKANVGVQDAFKKTSSKKY